jgi:multidrug efflux pump subunit AcrB
MLIVINFQSWLDPFIIITALPAALTGIVLFLFFTHTTLSVQALMGALMCLGIATANSILAVSFAKERLREHGDSVRASIESGTTRFRPVIMTALAMSSVEVLSGLTSEDAVILDPSDSIMEGSAVKIAEAAKPEGSK